MSRDDSAIGGDDLVIVGLDDQTGLALVLGQTERHVDLGETVDHLPVAQARRITEMFGVAAKFGPAFDADHGRWVRLTSESAKAMRDLGVAHDSTGTAMGVFRGADGRFAHVSRFDFISKVPFDPGTFAAALAVQQVVKQIEAKLEEIAQDVQALLRGSKNELEAQLVSAADIIARVERRVGDRGVVDDDDWVSLAALESIVKQAYHQTHLWLDPLRAFLSDDQTSLVEQVRALRGDTGIRDADFWLRMHVHSELVLKRWELLYLLRESQVAPERLMGEAGEVRERVEQRHRQLAEMTALLADYLDEDQPASLMDRIRFISRHRLAQLRRELAMVTNAYADALGRASVTVPGYITVPDDEPLIDVKELTRFVRESAMPGLESGARSAATTLASWGESGRRRLRDRTSSPMPDEAEPDVE